jgi:rhamnose utilization protein RhaD (predicted bifunctional aldolase and dehydrogenase)
MIQNRWSDADATGYLTRYNSPDVALRVYTSRLLGQEPRLVLHGGGNTSVKTTETDLFGVEAMVLAAEFLRKNRRNPVFIPRSPSEKEIGRTADIAPILRGCLANAGEAGSPTRWILDFRRSNQILEFVNGQDLSEYAIRSRAQSRGITEKEYMSGNLLGCEVTAEDVAQAFVHQALALKTTGNVTTVDGGNVAAFLRCRLWQHTSPATPRR